MEAVEYTSRLVEIDSVSHKSNQLISTRVSDFLTRLGFELEILSYVDANQQTKVSLVARRGTGLGGIAYLCHTDVVPVEDWDIEICKPFQPTIRSQRLYGRGSCDMKGSLACALAAVERISVREQSHPIYFVCTADEELGTVGAKIVDQQSRFFQEMVDCNTVGIVGEPTMLNVVHAHKGAFGCTITGRGIAAHSGTRAGVNANHDLIPILPFLLELQKQTENDPSLKNNSFDPPTLSWNITLQNEPLAVNITPSMARANIFLRPMPGVNHQPLLDMLQSECQRLGLEYNFIDRTSSWMCDPAAPHIQQMLKITETSVPQTVCFATDGGALQRMKNLVVCGPGDIAQAHRRDEYITLEQLQKGSDVFERAFRFWSCVEHSTTASTVVFSSKSAHSEISTEPNADDLDYTIRPAVAEDITAIQELMQPFVQQRKLLRRSRAELMALIPNGFVAESNDKIVGFSSVEVYSKKLGEIQGLVVEERFQGHGVGSELVRFCVQKAAEKGILEVMAISSSESFLRKLGFDYSLPDQKRALFFQLRSRDELYPDKPATE
jgi:acetylornithine deacetylase